jgi:competence protein ComEC
VLILGILLLAVGFLNIAGVAVGFLLTWSIKFINYVVFVVEGFPFSLVENIYITTFQSWLIMLAIASVVLVFEYRKFQFFIIACSVMMVFTFEQWHHNRVAFARTKFTVYNVAGHTAFDLMENGQTMFYTDSILMQDRDRIRFHIHPNRLFAGVYEVNPLTSSPIARSLPGGNLISWHGKIILYQHDKTIKLPDKLHIDYMIIGNNAGKLWDIKKLQSAPRLIILDSSNSYFYTSQFLKKAADAGLRVHSVKNDGAYEEYMKSSI